MMNNIVDEHTEHLHPFQVLERSDLPDLRTRRASTSSMCCQSTLADYLQNILTRVWFRRFP